MGDPAQGSPARCKASAASRQRQRALGFDLVKLERLGVMVREALAPPADPKNPGQLVLLQPRFWVLSSMRVLRLRLGLLDGGFGRSAAPSVARPGGTEPLRKDDADAAHEETLAPTPTGRCGLAALVSGRLRRELFLAVERRARETREGLVRLPPRRDRRSDSHRRLSHEPGGGTDGLDLATGRLIRTRTWRRSRLRYRVIVSSRRWRGRRTAACCGSSCSTRRRRAPHLGATVRLPEGVRAPIDEELGTAFDATARIQEEGVIVSWRSIEHRAPVRRQGESWCARRPRRADRPPERQRGAHRGGGGAGPARAPVAERRGSRG